MRGWMVASFTNWGPGKGQAWDGRAEKREDYKETGF